jgi:hypothetical protein
MTEQQYKEIQAWCQSGLNRKAYPEEYATKVALRNKATAFRRDIIFYRSAIKKAMFILEACKDEKKIKRWEEIIADHKEKKKHWQTQFDNL